MRERGSGAHSGRLLRGERGRPLCHGGHDCRDHCRAIDGGELLSQHSLLHTWLLTSQRPRERRKCVPATNLDIHASAAQKP
jgi:hypothetical protein